MIAIIDSGSTKSDWILLQKDGSEVLRTKTIGFNPYFVSRNDITKEIIENRDLSNISNQVLHLYFYGAGCSSPQLCKIIETGLQAVFPNAKILVQHDLLAAAYAAYNGKPSIVCILGTGSNSCYFNGETLIEETPSLSFILGDEGSGNNLGKRLLKSYFLKKMPKHLENAFRKKYNNLSASEAKKNIYQNKFANAYLASFSPFVSDYKHEPFIQSLIYDSIKEFFENQVLPYPQAKKSEINFIGSIAHYYEEILQSVAAEFHLTVGNIIRKPIDSLVRYHLDYIIPKIS